MQIGFSKSANNSIVLPQPSRKRVARTTADQPPAQNRPVNLESSIMALANCDCCSKANFNPITNARNCDNCLHKAFRTARGFFDSEEAIKCFDHYFNIYSSKNSHEWKSWCYNEFIKTANGLDNNKSIQHSFLLTYGILNDQRSVSICRKIWMFFMGCQCTKYCMQSFADSYKRNYSDMGVTLTSKNDFGDRTVHAVDLKEIVTLYNEANIGIDPSDSDMLKLGLIGRADFDTFLWFRDHFALAGDPQPNTTEVHLDKCDKSDIYQCYVNEFQEDSKTPLCYQNWSKFWSRVFPEVVIRHWKNVTGWSSYFQVIIIVNKFHVLFVFTCN